MSGCRIGRVKLKGAAAVLPFRQTDRDEMQRCIVEHAAKIANLYAAGEMDGFFIIGWDKTGAYSEGFRLPFDGAIGVTMFPSWVSDVIRRALISNGDWS